MQLFLYALIGSMFALIGGVVILWRSQDVKKIMMPLLAFASAAFLGVAFLDLLPEAVDALEEPHYAFIALLVGLTVFFTLERTLMKYLHKHPEFDSGNPPPRLAQIRLSGSDPVYFGINFNLLSYRHYSWSGMKQMIMAVVEQLKSFRLA